MSSGLADRIKQVRDFKSLVEYLRTELDWPIESDQVEELAFEWEPDELGLSSEAAVRISSVKQLRPLIGRQPWGIFYIEFEGKTMPVVVLRRILKSLTFKKKASADRAERRAWDTSDLLFICAAGEARSRGMTFAHFEDTGEGRARLKTFSWDESETHFHYLRSLNLEALRWPADSSNWAAWRSLWSAAFVTEPRQAINDSKQLSVKLAALAQRTRDVVLRLLEVEVEDGPLHGLFRSFKTVLIADLDEDAFADMLAQTIAYGLFSARVTGEGVLGLEHLEAMIPNTNPFLRELFAELASLGGPGTAQIDFDELGVGELVDLLNDMDVEAILQDFGKTSREGAEDPVIHFYEDFLKKYDSEQRMQRGVFYTPRPVVSFIVRSIDEILRTEFDLEDGLADTRTWAEMIERNPGVELPQGIEAHQPFLCILDPATGTGTFLVEVIDLVYSRMVEKWQGEGRRVPEIKDLWNAYVDAHLLRRLHGYELLMAPYAIAHLKIGLKLHETGYRFSTDQRLRVYMTNSLEPAGDEQIIIPGFPALAHEAEAVAEVKRRNAFTVLIGNPPYSGRSYNLTPHARSLVARYKELGGKPVVEKGALQFEKNLNDDYVKFLALAQSLTHGVPATVGLITNHSFLENPTLRGLRWNLLDQFSLMRLIDLGGNIARRDTGVDENVFDIGQGVAISLLASVPQSERRICIGKLKGKRAQKYEMLSDDAAGLLNSLEIVHPAGPLYLFRLEDAELRDEYLRGVSLVDVFPISSTGIKTHRDEFCIDFDLDALSARIRDLREYEKDDAEIRRVYGLADTHGWKLKTCRERLRADPDWREAFTQVLYRPFDWRHIYFSPHVVELPRMEVSHNFTRRRNLGLMFMRQVAGEQAYTHVLVTTEIAESRVFYSNRGTMSYAPLYFAPVNPSDLLQLGAPAEVVNLGPKYLERVNSVVGLGNPTPEQHLAYIYGVLHSLTFRLRYEPFLKVEFPRVPIPAAASLFWALAEIGQVLIRLHSAPAEVNELRDSAAEKIEERFISRVGWANGTVWLDATKVDSRNDYFATRPGRIGIHGVPEDAWRFKIGGYQVCHKWLKDRKGRILSDADLANYRHIVAAIGETIRTMPKSDEVIENHGGWPDAFAGPTISHGDC